jgi:hypothetical protein
MRTAAVILLAFILGFLFDSYLTSLRTDLCFWEPMEPIKALEK